ncbi:MAG: cache domain-containing protein [Pseudomonadota bacterium]|nr:cache domain-containing protein [Polaromonas sp.]
MKKLLQVLVFGLAALSFNMTAMAAGEQGSAAEATALVKKAIAYIKANGREKAFAEFGNPNGPFRDRDLYMTTVDTDGKMLAHGVNPKLVGKSLIELKDIDGKYFVKEYVDLAKTKGSGWVDFKWPNPITKVVQQKSMYVEKMDDLVVGCGIYK